ncbi:MAG: DUF952 domain-containing protein [Cyclobacteriaceae bacterium]|nr:DUF952 domain-containing protein [Cyclobacteriaceae bacterium]
MIYHIISITAWNAQQDADAVHVPSLQTEGFIHCCTREQIAGVLSRYFKEKDGLLLLEIDESKLTAPVRFEVATDNELFPHVFGSINRSAIVGVKPIGV